MSKKMYELKIEPITAVHIGTGNEITPLDYKITNRLGTVDLKKAMYIKFSSDKILKRLIETENKRKLSEFDRASILGNMKVLQDFFQNECVDFSDIDYPCEITKEFLRLCNSNAEKDPYQNAAKVNQMYRPEGQKTPVIPGSSIKGAIRTAILNKELYHLSDDEYDDLREKFENRGKAGSFESNLQKQLLGNYKDAKADPFRCLEISDCVFVAKNSQIVGALKNIYTNSTGSIENNTKNMQIQAEVIKGCLMDTHTTGQGVFRLNLDLAQSTDTISKSLSLQDIVKSCNEFYLRQFEKEYESFYKNSVDSECESITKLYQTIKAIAKDNPSNITEFILRVGRWSQVEFVTFDSPFRNPQTPRGKDGRNKDWGTTRTVFNYDGQYLPLGWCKCSISEKQDSPL